MLKSSKNFICKGIPCLLLDYSNLCDLPPGFQRLNGWYEWFCIGFTILYYARHFCPQVLAYLYGVVLPGK